MTLAASHFVGAPDRRMRRTSDRTPLHVTAHFTVGSLTIEGWTLNESPAGLRAIVEDAYLLPNSVVEVRLNFETGTRRKMRVVWSRKVVGGSVFGLVDA